MQLVQNTNKGRYFKLHPFLDDVKVLAGRDTILYRARNFISIPPFLMQVVLLSLSANQGNVVKALLEVV